MGIPETETAGWVIVWEFRVRSKARHFEEVYGAGGAWVRLMRNRRGYVGSALHCDANDPWRYLAIDRWDAVEAYVAFREKYEVEYRELDRDCEELTEWKVEIGTFGAAIG